MQTWVFISHAKVTFDAQQMEQYLRLNMASTIDEAKEHVPKSDGKFCLGLLRQFTSDYIIAGKTQSGEILDISRKGMIKKVTEFTEYLFSKLNTSLGPLGANGWRQL